MTNEGIDIAHYSAMEATFIIHLCRESWRLIGASFMPGLTEGEAIQLSAINSNHSIMIKLNITVF